MSARHTLDDRRWRSTSRARTAARARTLPKPRPRIVVGNAIDVDNKAVARDAMQKALGHRQDARQWNRANVARLYYTHYEFHELDRGRGRTIAVLVRTSFRNIIDENGRHI